MVGAKRRKEDQMAQVTTHENGGSLRSYATCTSPRRFLCSERSCQGSRPFGRAEGWNTLAWHDMVQHERKSNEVGIWLSQVTIWIDDMSLSQAVYIYISMWSSRLEYVHRKMIINHWWLVPLLSKLGWCWGMQSWIPKALESEQALCASFFGTDCLQKWHWIYYVYWMDLYGIGPSVNKALTESYHLRPVRPWHALECCRRRLTLHALNLWRGHVQCMV